MANAVSALEWSSDGSGVAAASCAGDVVVLTEEGEPAWPLEEHGAGVLCLSWSPDGCRLAVGGEDATVRTWGRPRSSEQRWPSPSPRPDRSWPAAS